MGRTPPRRETALPLAACRDASAARQLLSAVRNGSEHVGTPLEKGPAMSTKMDYTDDEWNAISGAPVAAGLLITLADASGPVGIAREALAVGKAIAQSATGDAPEVVKAVAHHVKHEGGRPQMPDVPAGDRAQTKNALISAVRKAVRAVEDKSPGEAEAYKTWLASVAARVSQASKEGGFLGFGGTVVSSAEEESLRELADVLGPRARPPVE